MHTAAGKPTQPSCWPLSWNRRLTDATWALGFLSLLFTGPAIQAADAEEEDIAPVATETIAPLAVEAQELQDLSGLSVPIGPRSTLDPQLYAELKAAAAVDPNAEIPDALVPLVFPTKGKATGELEARQSTELLSLTAAASTLRSFAGLDYGTSGNAPPRIPRPDTIVGKSSTRVLEGTNSALRLSSPTGAGPTGPIPITKSLNDFFGANAMSEGILFDPRVVYDRLGPNQRFFVVALQRDEGPNGNTASIYLAVSRSANPDDLNRETPSSPGSWCVYKINSVRDLNPGPATWADFPMVGVGADAFLISNDQFTFDQDQTQGVDYDYKYGILRVIRKDLITNNASGACPAASSSIFVLTTQLAGTAGTDLSMGHVQPAQHYTAPSPFSNVTNPVYMVSTVVPPSATYRVWRIKNVASGSPFLNVRNITAQTQYLMPVDARQPSGGVALLDTNDARVMQVSGVGDVLWATHTTSCSQPPPAPFNKACIRVVRLLAGDSGGTITASIQQDLTFASPGSDTDLSYYMPGLAVNAGSHAALVFLFSSPMLYQGSSWTIKFPADLFFTPGFVLAEGKCARISSGVGDFLGAQTNPNDLVSFWLAGEAAAPSSAGCTWRTQIVQVTP